MALQTSGAISLLNIQTEFGGTAPISISEYYGKAAGIPASGTISLSSFYGKRLGYTIGLFYSGQNGTPKSPAVNNTVTRINANGALVGSETAAGTARTITGGASVGGNGLFYGGFITSTTSTTYYNTVTRINANGALVGSETAVGTARNGASGASVGDNGLFYAGTNISSGYVSYLNTVTRINANGALVGSQTTVGTARGGSSGASVGGNGLFYGGFTTPTNYSSTTNYNTVTRIDANGALVGSETAVGTARDALSGASVGDNGLFYAGSNKSAIVTRINANGAIVGSETTVGTAVDNSGGASVGDNGLFYAGANTNLTYLNTVTRINANGALVGSQTTVGTARGGSSGASL